MFSVSEIGEHARVRSLALQLGLVCGIPFAIATFLELDLKRVFRLRATTRRNLIASALLGVCCIPILDEVAFWQVVLTGVSAQPSVAVQSLLRGQSFSEIIWIMVASAVIPAFCEEFFFRGFLLDRFLATGQVGQSLTMTALLFGLFHFNLSVLLTTSLAGLLLAFVVWRTDSIFGAIIIHFVVNAWAVCAFNIPAIIHLPWIGGDRRVPIAVLAFVLAGAVWLGTSLTSASQTASSADRKTHQL